MAELISQIPAENGGREVFVGLMDGRTMQDWEGVFESFGNTFDFPDYYGRNLNALIECLGDLEWLPFDGYVIVIDSSELLLIREQPDDINYFIEIMTNEVVHYWARPIDLGESWDRSSKPFRILLHQPESTEQVLHPAIASLPFVSC
ncbi:MAG: barstar family protein [Planctomycetaceae bacterium]|nr:barstar family protein [Planctomycetaceae bacterium]